MERAFIVSEINRRLALATDRELMTVYYFAVSLIKEKAGENAQAPPDLSPQKYGREK